MNNEEFLVCKVLRRMCGTAKGVPGNMHYNFLQYNFYDFEDLCLLPKEEYEKLIIGLSRQELISIDFNGSERYESAKITATPAAVEFLSENIQKE